MKRISLFLLFFVATSMTPLASGDEKHHPPSTAATAAEAHWADGEVRRVDKEAQRLTIRHGPLPSLDMPTAMTMVYRVRDAAILEQVQPGDKVRFQAEKVSGAFTVTAIEAVK